jgi:Flp pilus assembly protein TadB
VSVGGWVCVLAAAAGSALLVGHRARSPTIRPAATGSSGGLGPLHRYRWWWCSASGFGVGLLVGGRVGVATGVVAAIVTWILIGRAEPAGDRRRREAVRRDLPHLVGLFAATLRAGAAPSEGIAVVCAALPGAAADRLAGVVARLELGLDPGAVWATLEDDPDLARLGRALARAHRSGAPVLGAVERLCEDLGQVARADTEQRARAVGVRAAVPLGLCLLPAFLLLGIVPLVAALIDALDL